jgi:hypothetical protein
MVSHIAGITGVHIYAQLALNLNLPDLCLPSSWDYRYLPLCPSAVCGFLHTLDKELEGYCSCTDTTAIREGSLRSVVPKRFSTGY